MLAIRMQRTGRKGHAMFRVVVQDSRRTPTSGKVVAQIGSYDPHSKSVVLQKDKAAYYLGNGAQPSDRVVQLLVSEGVKLPDWVKKTATDKQRSVRNPEKLRRNRPAEEATAEQSAPDPVEASETTETESSADTAESEPAPQTTENSEAAPAAAVEPAPESVSGEADPEAPKV
jgi:small subunit ribosomal protein S16